MKLKELTKCAPFRLDMGIFEISKIVTKTPKFKKKKSKNWVAHETNPGNIETQIVYFLRRYEQQLRARNPPEAYFRPGQDIGSLCPLPGKSKRGQKLRTKWEVASMVIANRFGHGINLILKLIYAAFVITRNCPKRKPLMLPDTLNFQRAL